MARLLRLTVGLSVCACGTELTVHRAMATPCAARPTAVQGDTTLHCGAEHADAVQCSATVERTAVAS